MAALAALGVPGVAATPQANATRLMGEDRYGTARAIAESLPAPPRDRPGVLVRGDDFPDALGSALLAAGGGGGPIVLTPPSFLHDEALRALRSARVSVVNIVGSEAAIHPAVQQRLEAEGFTVLRHGGDDRYETAVAANNPLIYGDCDCYPDDTVFVASGETFPDALAAGSLAFAEGMPIFLTRRDSLPEVTRQALEKYAKKVYLLGGEAAVTPGVEAEIRSACRDILGRPEECVTVERIAGANRSATSVKVAELAISRGWTIKHVNLARGDAFPDAIAGGPHGGYEAAPVLLTESPNALSAELEAFLRAHSATIESLHVFGSGAAVSDEVVQQAVAAARG